MTRRVRRTVPSTPLAHTDLQVHISDLSAEFLVRHRFRNDSSSPIEAVFSFPVPLDAAFLGMTAKLGGETLTAEIQPKAQAARTYDDAIAEGHASVLLSNPEPGVLCMSLGNLNPEEEGEIELRFATPLHVADSTARLNLPLVHRPRYGAWRLEELETPTHDFAVEHPMSASIAVTGLLASAAVTCSSHAARFSSGTGRIDITLQETMLDGDVSLSFDLSTAVPSSARLIEDGDNALGVLSLVLPSAGGDRRPIDLCLALDCSGSMAGDAIAQSRQAVKSVIAALEPEDRIQAIRFGSSAHSLFRRPLKATSTVKAALSELTDRINADLGGTEMGDALEACLRQLPSAEEDRSRVVILVTDGAVQPDEVRQATQAASEAGVRIFVVAVGSSAGAEVLGPLAKATRGTMERAVPGESISDGVMRHFRRARLAGPVSMTVSWPSEKLAEPRELPGVYPGDAFWCYAVLPQDAKGEVRVECPILGLREVIALEDLASLPQLRALIGQHRYKRATGKRRAELALKYGLLTEDTSAVLVKLRAPGERTTELPTIVRVPQMVSRGMVTDTSYHMAASAAAPMSSVDPVYSIARCLPRGPLDVPAFLRLQADDLSADDMPPDFEPTRDEPVLMRVVVVQPETAERICAIFYTKLLETWRQSPASMPTLKQLVRDLPDDLQEDADCLRRAFHLAKSRRSDSIRLLFALDTVLGHHTMSDDDEANFVMQFDLEHADDGASFPSEDREQKLQNDILRTLQDPTEVSIKVRRSKALGSL